MAGHFGIVMEQIAWVLCLPIKTQEAPDRVAALVGGFLFRISYITHVLPTLIIGAGREFVKQGFGNDLRLVSSLLIL